MKRIKVGVIGLGQVAQIIHLPILETLSDRFEIGAICDVSPGLLQAIGDRYRVEQRYADIGALLLQPDLDAVLILNNDEYHADHTIAALQHGKHVLVEKPMCLTARDGDSIVKARDEAGKQVLVAYMRVYAPAFAQAVEEVKRLPKINYVRVRDIIGANQMFIDQTSSVLRFDDIPEVAKTDRAERAGRLVAEAIGAAAPKLTSVYRLLLGLSSHDLSAMREMIGMPRRVVAANQWNGGRFITATFEYDGYFVTFETGVDAQLRFDAHIEVLGAMKTVRVQYDTPYIRHLPTTVIIQETKGDAFEERVIRPTFKDPYTHELEHFYSVVVDGVIPKTPPEDAIEDLSLMQEIVRVLHQTE